MERDSYLLELARYIVLNPVRAKTVSSVGHYPWSSYPATLGLAPAPAWLTLDREILSPFASTRSVARKRYAAFVAEEVAQTSPWSALKGQALLGGEVFVRKMAPRLQERASVHELTKRLLYRPTLKQVFADTKTKKARNATMERAYREYAYTLSLHYATVSRLIKAVEDKWSEGEM